MIENDSKNSRPVQSIGLLLWPIAIILTIVYWREIRAASWQWQVAIGVGYLFLLGTLRSAADDSAELDSQLRGINTLASEGKYAEALKIAESALKNSPENAALLYIKGKYMLKLGREQEAEKAYLEALQKDPSHAYAANNLGTLYMNTGRYLEAAKYYRQAQKAGASGDWFDRNIKRIWNNLTNKGAELANGGDLLEAAEYYRLAQEFGASGEPFSSNLKYLKGDLIRKTQEAQNSKNYELALKYVNVLIDFNAKSAMGYAWRGAILSGLCRYKEAIRDLQRCRKLDPSYRPTEIEGLIQDVECVLAESQKLSMSPQITTIRDKSSTTEQTLWKVGQYAFNRLQVKKIVKGGMGDIYICWDRAQHVPFVLKTIKLSKLISSTRTKGKGVTHRKLFKREAQSWLQLGHHPNIVQLHTVEDFEHRHLVLCMEYIAGELDIGPTLRHHLDHRIRLPAKEVIAIGVNICDAMQFAYDKLRLVHRDLKPENIFLTETGVAKVGDFGLAVQEGDSEAVQAGTPPYIAPEQLVRPSSPTMDIYTTGFILYESLAGRRPIPQEGTWRKTEPLEEWVSRHRHVQPVPLTEANAGVPSDLVKIVMKCLSKQPERRFQSFSELREALVKCAEDLGLKVAEAKADVRDSAHQAVFDLYREAISLDSLGSHEEALEKYREVVQSEPFRSKVSMAWCNMGKVLATLGHCSEALKCFQKAIKIDPNDTHALFGKANILAHLGKSKEAQEAIRILLEVDSEYGDAHVCKGFIMLHSGRIDKAEVAYQKALEMHPTKQHPFALNGLGLCARQRYLFAKALDYFDRAIAAKSDYAEAYSHRCDILCMLDRVEEAINSGEKAVGFDPSVAGYRISLAMAYNKANDFDNAASHFEKAIELDLKEGFTWFGLATSYVGLGRLDDAIQCARHAAKLGYSDAQQLIDEIERRKYGKA
jgi:tetratricopeptide (TPR) repeat protein